MKLAKATLTSIMTAVASATILGSPGDSHKPVMLFKNNITPDENTLFAELDEADFDGYAQIDLTDAVGVSSIDPLSGMRQVTLQTDGNLQFLVTGATNLPQTIYGYAVLNVAGNAIVMIQRFDEPQELTAIGHAVYLGPIQTELAPDAFK